MTTPTSRPVLMIFVVTTQTPRSTLALAGRSACAQTFGKEFKKDMAWFISFYKKTSAEKKSTQVGNSYRLDNSSPKDDRPCPESRIESAIGLFQKDHGVTDWREIADRYETSELNYD